MSNDIFHGEEGSLQITTEKDETGAIRVVRIEPTRKKNKHYNEEDNTKNSKGDVIND